MVEAKGIFCLEGDWWNRLERASTVEPILGLLHRWDPFFVPYIHRDVATRTEFEHYVRMWAQRRYAKYPVLYLAFHGEESEILLGDRRKPENRVSLDELGEILAGKCAGRIIYFGSCDTLALHGHSINAFLRRTGAVAVFGYRARVDWLDSTIFELIVFSTIQVRSMTRRGVESMLRRIHAHSPVLYRKLEFHAVVNQE